MEQEEKVEKKPKPKEEEFLFRKKIVCSCCDKEFETLQLKSGRVKRLEPDLDLRPRCEQLDTLKYGVTSCPYCGYTALSKNFDTLTSIQRKLLKENVCSKFRMSKVEPKSVYTYQMAIDYHKLALINSVEKKGKVSERAYICLLIAWLDRGWREQLESGKHKSKKNDEIIELCKAEEEKFLTQAYKGFVEALATETPPFCGLDMTTLEYLIACLAWEQKEYETASKTVSQILTSKTASRHVKDKALVLKDLIVAEMKKNE